MSQLTLGLVDSSPQTPRKLIVAGAQVGRTWFLRKKRRQRALQGVAQSKGGMGWWGAFLVLSGCISLCFLLLIFFFSLYITSDMLVNNLSLPGFTYVS